jgi:hypothetical protein
MGGLCMATGNSDARHLGAACKPAAVPLKDTAFKLHDAVDQAVVPLLSTFPYLNTPIPGTKCKPKAVPLGTTAYNLHDAVDQAATPFLTRFPYLNTPTPGAGATGLAARK